jgi:hypothetical protein
MRRSGRDQNSVRNCFTWGSRFKTATMRAAFAVLILPPVQARASVQYIGPHPHAKSQSTLQGKTISVIAGSDGPVYSGSGDTVNDTDPSSCRAMTPTGILGRTTSRFGRRRWGVSERFPGILWTPAFDPQGRIDIGYADGNDSHRGRSTL